MVWTGRTPVAAHAGTGSRALGLISFLAFNVRSVAGTSSPRVPTPRPRPSAGRCRYNSAVRVGRTQHEAM
jgi:hypothetical protein